MRTSSTELSRPAWWRLLATLGIAALALGGAAAARLESTGALYTAEASTTITGFQVQSLCDWDGYESVQDLLEELGPPLHWGFDPDEETVPWTAVGGAAAAESTGTPLVCDDGVLPLSADQSVWSTPPVSDPVTAILVLGTPTVAGTALTLAEPAGGGGFDVRVTATDVSLHAWDTSVPSAALATVAFEPGTAHVIAVVLDGTAATLWVDGSSNVGTLPAALGTPTLGLGAVPGTEPDGETPTTASFAATELALVPAVVPDATLDALVAAATAP